MMSDSLAVRVRAAVDAFPVPALPAATVAARIAAAGSAAPRKHRPAAVIVGGGFVLAAALAVGVPNARYFTPAYYATLERLTGKDWSHAKIYEVPPMSLAEARRHTTFPIVVPRGKRVLNVDVYPHDAGVTLELAVDNRAQAVLDEHWAGATSKLDAKMQGIGIHDDGSIRRFNVRRWRIGRVEFSMPMFTREYHRYADEVERATREAARASGG